MYHKHGPRSSQYHTALKLFTPLVQSLQTHFSTQHVVTITTVPPTTYHKPLSALSARTLETTFGNEHSWPVLSMTQNNQHSIFGVCHTTESGCIKATNNCSSHGTCVESVATNGCWTCLCKPTVRELSSGGGKQTTYWAGEECQKKDISVPFHLFFWVDFPCVCVLFSVYNCPDLDCRNERQVALECWRGRNWRSARKWSQSC